MKTSSTFSHRAIIDFITPLNVVSATDLDTNEFYPKVIELDYFKKSNFTHFEDI